MLLEKISDNFYKVNDKTNGEMAERLNAAVLKTVLVKANGGSNPSFSAQISQNLNFIEVFFMPFFV